MSRLLRANAPMLSALCSGLIAQGFQSPAAPSGIHGVPLSTASFGSGMCTADFDGDADIDVVIATPSGGLFRYYRNDGNMQFSDLSNGCGLGICGHVLRMEAADIDNDGDQDVFVANDLQPAQLFVNSGSGVFAQEAQLRGLINIAENYGASFGDYDRDGWLDLYLGNRYPFGASSVGAANLLYRNLGNGYFTDVTATAGLGGTGLTFVSAFFDYDEDGWPDLIDVNDKGGLGVPPNQVYRNNGNGTFTNVSAQIGANSAISGMGFDFVDVFNDGGVDYYCTDVPVDHLFQRWRPATQSYVDNTATYGLQGGGIGWACNFLDYDNDGWQDLHVVQEGVTNLLFHNPRQPASTGTPWPNTAPGLGLAFTHIQHTAAVADFDDDGRVDVLNRFSYPALDGVALMRNLVSNNKWLKFSTRGTVSNRDGLGARIEVRSGSLHQRQWVRSGVGYVTCSDRRVHFGLGAAPMADLVTVTWPSGQQQYLHHVAANQIVQLVEPSMTASPAQVGASATIDVSIPGDEGLVCVMALAFAESPPTAFPDGKIVPLRIDELTGYALVAGNPILPASIGILDAAGAASSALNIPPLAALSGLTFYATAVTIDTPRFALLRTVFPRALAITIR